MTGLNYQIKFQQYFQDHLAMDLNIITLDIEYYINRGQQLYIDEANERFKGQEELRKRLGSLFVQRSIQRVGEIDIAENAIGYEGEGVHNNSEVWKIPGDVRYVKDEAILLDSILMPVKPVTHDYYNKQSSNPFKKPWKKLVWRLEAGDKLHEFIKPNAEEISEYRITYIKNPEVIDIYSTDEQGDVPEEYTNEVVEKAVEVALRIFQVSGSLRAPKQ